jgi:hypothetical protein
MTRKGVPPPLSRPAPWYTADGAFDWAAVCASPAWTLDEALCLFHDAPVVLRIKHRPLAKSVELHIGKEVRELFLRQIEASRITDPATPAQWLALAESIGIPIPSGLRTAAFASAGPAQPSALGSSIGPPIRKKPGAARL